nr:type I-C CRISPR-associated protein Cas8c/Csd1 [uncultured Roseococcus sp.]
MSLLQALDGYYGRMAARGEAGDLGFTTENISFALSLRQDGSILGVQDLRSMSGKRLVPARMSVPRPKRTSDIRANFLWDKTAYAFGVDDGKSKRLAEEHGDFRKRHQDMLFKQKGPHAAALLSFLEKWRPENFQKPHFDPEMVNASFVFRLEDERRYLHDIPELRQLWMDSLRDTQAQEILCLVTGRYGPLEPLHPVIKNVEGAQTAGAYLVSFNAGAFTSYGMPTDGSNAPVSKDAAARYGAALNTLLERASPNRLPRPIGDASVIFWADAREEVAKPIEDAFAGFFSPPAPEGPVGNPERDAQQAAQLRDALQRVAEGRPHQEGGPQLEAGVRFSILGLSPNAARLSVRFWMQDRFEVFAKRLAEHYDDLSIEPPPWRAAPPSVSRLLVKTTAAQEKFENIPPQLAGEVTRAVLTGGDYPRQLLSAALRRLRANDEPDAEARWHAAAGWHAAAIRAVLAREGRKHRREIPPVSLNREEPNAAYQLGRMFAMAEIAQRMALGKVNATIRDRYFGAASATPAGVFPLLLRGMQNHLAKLRKDGKGGFIERELDQIAEQLPSALPRSLRLEEQGRFVIGYYHQRRAPVAGKPVEELEAAETPEGGETNV